MRGWPEWGGETLFATSTFPHSLQHKGLCAILISSIVLALNIGKTESKKPCGLQILMLRSCVNFSKDCS